MNSVSRLAFLALPLLLVSCEPAQRHEIDREVERFAYLVTVGPVHITSIAGMSATGVPLLSVVSSDYGWRIIHNIKMRPESPETDIPPSPFEIPDPNRPVIIGESEK
jgi:hypothetical protein